MVAFNGFLWIVTEDPNLDPNDSRISAPRDAAGALFRLRLSEAAAWDGSGIPPGADLVLTAAHGSEIIVAEGQLWISQHGQRAIVAVDPEFLALTTRLCTVPGRLRLICGNPDRDFALLDDLGFELASRTLWARTWNPINPIWSPFWDPLDPTLALTRIQIQLSP